MDHSYTVKSSCVSIATDIVNGELAEDNQSASQLKYDSSSHSRFRRLSVRMNVRSVLQKNKIIQALSLIFKHGSKKNAISFSPSTIQDEEEKPDSFRFIVTINRLAKLILGYLNNPIWKYIGVAILPTMQEYRDAWVDLLEALTNNTKTSRRYTCFLTLLPKAVARDLASILKKFRQDLFGEETLSIRSTLQRLWRSPEWQYSELRPEVDRWVLKGSYNANVVAGDDLLTGLSNIQHFAALLTNRSNPCYTGKENCILESPINIQIERVKDIMFKMSEARQLLEGKLEIETCSYKSLDYA